MHYVRSIAKGLLLIAFFSLFNHCSKEDAIPEIIEPVRDFYSLEPGHSWTYRREYMDKAGDVVDIRIERWVVDSIQPWVNFFDLTDSMVYLGYKILYEENRLLLRDVVGDYLTTKYRWFPADTLIPIASRDDPIPFQRWIFGGTKEMNTLLGPTECLCTKSIYHRGQPRREEVYEYFCKDLGKALEEHFFIDTLPDGTEEIYASRKMILLH